MKVWEVLLGKCKLHRHACRELFPVRKHSNVVCLLVFFLSGSFATCVATSSKTSDSCWTTAACMTTKILVCVHTLTQPKAAAVTLSARVMVWAEWFLQTVMMVDLWPSGYVNTLSFAYSELRQRKKVCEVTVTSSNFYQVILESKWAFVANVMKFSSWGFLRYNRHPPTTGCVILPACLCNYTCFSLPHPPPSQRKKKWDDRVMRGIPHPTTLSSE